MRGRTSQRFVMKHYRGSPPRLFLFHRPPAALSPYIYTPPKRRRWPLLAIVGVCGFCILQLKPHMTSNKIPDQHYVVYSQKGALIPSASARPSTKQKHPEQATPPAQEEVVMSPAEAPSQLAGSPPAREQTRAHATPGTRVGVARHYASRRTRRHDLDRTLAHAAGTGSGWFLN